MDEYYNQKIECMPLEQIRDLQLSLFNKQLKQAKKTIAYKNIMPDCIRDLSEIKNLPFTTKEDLHKASTFDFLAVPQKEIARFNSTSGTTGEPVIIYYSKKDINEVAKIAARNHFMAGIRRQDVCQTISSSNMHIGGWYFINGCLELKTPVFQTGPGNTERQINFLKKLKPTFCFSTSGYFIHLLSRLSCEDKKEINLKGCIIGAEPTSLTVTKNIKEKYNIDVFDIYVMTEAGGPFAQDCKFHKGLHIPEDYIYIEIIDPKSGDILPDGEYGELVITPLHQEAMPLIRYRTRDISRILPEQCECGRTHRRIEAVSHRMDDLLIINGCNVFPTQIEECIHKYLPIETNYLIHVLKNNGLSKLLIDIEISDEILSNENLLEELRKNLFNTLKASIIVNVNLNFIPLRTLMPSQIKKRIFYQESS